MTVALKGFWRPSKARSILKLVGTREGYSGAVCLVQKDKIRNMIVHQSKIPPAPLLFNGFPHKRAI